MEKPDVQCIKGISPTISIDQKHSSYYFNSTVGTISEVSQYMRLLYAKVGEAYCPECGRKIEKQTVEDTTVYIITKDEHKFQFATQRWVYWNHLNKKQYLW